MPVIKCYRCNVVKVFKKFGTVAGATIGGNLSYEIAVFDTPNFDNRTMLGDSYNLTEISIVQYM